MEELTRSDKARQLGVVNMPDGKELEHLRELVEKLLDPLREEWGHAIIVTSGFRSQKVNDSIKGSSKTSAHRLGYAADIVPADMREINRFKVFVRDWLRRNRAQYDQYIDERNLYGSQWVHLGLRNSEGRQRRQMLRYDGKRYVGIE